MFADIWNKLLAKPQDGQFGASPWTIIISFVSCALLFAYLEQTGAALPRKQLKRGRADRIEWNVRVVSSIHAVVLVVGESLVPQHVLLMSCETQANPIHALLMRRGVVDLDGD